jgi:hypothetical protein
MRRNAGAAGREAGGVRRQDRERGGRSSAKAHRLALRITIR